MAGQGNREVNEAGLPGDVNQLFRWVRAPVLDVPRGTIIAAGENSYRLHRMQAGNPAPQLILPLGPGVPVGTVLPFLQDGAAQVRVARGAQFVHTFDRAASTTSPGAADTGQPVAAISGAIGINEAGLAYNGGGTIGALAVWDAGVPVTYYRVTVGAGIGSDADNYTLAYRVQDAQNVLILAVGVTTVGWYTGVGGAYTAVSPGIETGGLDAGDVIECSTDEGGVTTARRNGAVLAQTSSTAFAGATRAGIGFNGGAAALDDLIFGSPALRVRGDALRTRNVDSVGTAEKIGTDDWLVYGDLVA